MTPKQFQLIERKICPACNSRENLIPIYQKSYQSLELQTYLTNFYNLTSAAEKNILSIQGEYNLIKCSNCSLLYQKYIPDPDGMKLLYDGIIDLEKDWQEHRYIRDDLQYYLRHLDEIVNLVNYFQQHPSRLNFLDFGAGWSQWAKLAQSLGVNSYIAELSQPQIVYGESLGLKNIDIYSHEPNFFDFINTEQVLEHVSEPRKIVTALYKLLKQGGILKISVPSSFLTEKRIKNIDWTGVKSRPNSLNEIAPLEHLNTFNAYSLNYMCSNLGFKKIRLPLVPTLLSKSSILRNLLLPIIRENSFLRFIMYLLLKIKRGEYIFFVKN